MLMAKKSNPKLSQALIARAAALNCLMAVVQKGQSLDKALHLHCHDASLTPQDRGFSEHLVRCTLKRRWTVMPILASHLKQPFKKLPVIAQWLILMGAAQCRYMDVPAYAAVNTTVELAKHHRLHGLSGMMNAVLKKVAAEKDAETTSTDLLHSMPDWLTQRLIQDYRKEQAYRIIAASIQDVDALDITLKPDISLDDWAKKLNAHPIAGHGLRLATNRNIPELPGFEDGAWWVQDAASALPIYGIRGKLQGKRVLDACAAPGGKTMQLCAYEAEVTALDRSKKRLERLQQNLQRTGLKASVVCADLLDYQPETPFDIVVLDAPCSATGTLRRNPDILYHRSASDIENVIDLQRALIRCAAEWVVPGGHLLYCVCSLFKEEGEAHLSLLQELGFSALPVPDWQALAPLPVYDTSIPCYRSLPHYLADDGGMDGFFALWCRKDGKAMEN